MEQASPRRILIIDDNPVDRIAYRGMLSRSNEPPFVFLEAEMGEEGLALYLQERPDCVLLDYNLPDYDGIEFLIELREQCGEDEPLPVIVLSGHEDNALSARTMRYGAQNYLVKGEVSFTTLFHTILSTLEKVDLYHQLKQKEKELGQFASITSHKIRSSLSKVVSYNQLLQHRYAEFLDDRGLLYLESALEGADEIRQTIEALLRYARTECSPKTFGNVPLQRVFEHVEQKQKELLRLPDTHLLYSTPLPCVYGDEIALTLLFNDLICTSVAFHNPDKPLHISIQIVQKDGLACFQLHSNNLSIDADERSNFFNAFHTVRTPEGDVELGMRMLLCKKITELHGGSLELNSPQDVGLQFAFQLPLSSSEYQQLH